METYSEIVYYINEEGFIIKHYKDEVPFTWVYLEPVDDEYSEYQAWLDAGNKPAPIVGEPKKDM